MNNEVKVYQDIMNSIIARTQGRWELMNYSDKVLTITIMRIIKEQMDDYFLNVFPTVCAWANLDIKDIQLNETEPDLSQFREQESLFNKLMGL